MPEKNIASGWTLRMKPEGQGEEAVKTLFFDLKIDDRGVVSGNVFNAKDDGVTPEEEPFSKVTGRRQPSDNPDGSLMSLSFTSGDFGIFMSGFTFVNEPFTRFEGRYISSALDGLAPEEVSPGSTMLASGPGETGTGTGQQT